MQTKAMNRFLFYILCAIVLGGLTSCHDSEDGPGGSDVTEKTIFVYMPWTASEHSTANNLYGNFMDNIRDMEAAIGTQGGLGNNRMLVFISKSAHYSALVEVKYRDGRCLRDTLKRYTDFDYTTAANLASILRDVKSYAPANIYDMLIGCHGSGWLPKGSNPAQAKSRAFGGATATYQTEIPTLADGIRQAGMHMQFISFDDCYMAAVEVAYDLKDVTDFLIASTSEIMAAGMPYKDIWRYITPSEPDYGAIVDGFYNFYSAYIGPDEQPYPYGTLSVINCRQAEPMAQIMQTINSQYTFDPAKLAAVQRLDGYNNTVFYDMGSYVRHLCSDATLLDSYLNAEQLLVPYKKATQRIYSNYDIQYTDVLSFSGITISDPTRNPNVTAPLQRTAWYQATH